MRNKDERDDAHRCTNIPERLYYILNAAKLEDWNNCINTNILCIYGTTGVGVET